MKRNVERAAGLLHIAQYLELDPVKLSDGQVARVAAPPDAAVAAGSRTGVSPDPARVMWIDPANDRAIPAAA